MNITFDNRFVDLLPGEERENNQPRQVHGAFWSPVTPTRVASPRLLAFSDEMAEALGLSKDDMRSPEMLDALSGNGLLEGMKPFSMCYGGHQFGGWAGQLGDGRAINLGEAKGVGEKRWTLQLKGAGPTPYSRRADGRAVLRSSIREFLCSEAMFHLGVPTTRALSLVLTGDQVMRDMFYDGRPEYEPGAIVCRVSPSFIRFGNFEIFAARGEHHLLRRLVDFVVEQDMPEVTGEGEERVVNLFEEVCRRTALMVSHWMRVGFVHGVMNTDNMSILGLTIDYGPYGWIDNYDPHWTPNTTDLPRKRYRFGHQPLIAHWNLLRLANSLASLLEDPQRLAPGLELFAKEYEEISMNLTYQKFGLPGDSDDEKLMALAYSLMEESEVDMTLFFRALPTLSKDSTTEELSHIFYDGAKLSEHQERWTAWLKDFTARVATLEQDGETRRSRMNAVNPLYVPRNYLVQEAIDLAEQGDYSRIHQLLDVFRNPYQEQTGCEHFAQPRPEWAKKKPGCSMLSCSS